MIANHWEVQEARDYLPKAVLLLGRAVIINKSGGAALFRGGRGFSQHIILDKPILHHNHVDFLYSCIEIPLSDREFKKARRISKNISYEDSQLIVRCNNINSNILLSYIILSYITNRMSYNYIERNYNKIMNATDTRYINYCLDVIESCVARREGMTTDPRFLYGTIDYQPVGSTVQDITRTYGTTSQKIRYPRIEDFFKYGITSSVDT